MYSQIHEHGVHTGQQLPKAFINITNIKIKQFITIINNNHKIYQKWTLE